MREASDQDEIQVISRPVRGPGASATSHLQLSDVSVEKRDEVWGVAALHDLVLENETVSVVLEPSAEPRVEARGERRRRTPARAGCTA
jgi:hypothetical protein